MCNRTNSSELDNTGGIYLAAARNLRICLLLFPTHNGRSRSWNQENVEQNLLGGRADPGLQDAPLPSVDQDAHHGIQGRDEQHVRQEGEEGDDEHPCPEGAVEGDAPEQQGASVPRKNCGCVSGRGTGGGGAVAVDLFPLRRGQFSDSEEVCGARNFVQRGPECENAHGLGVFRDDAWRKIPTWVLDVSTREKERRIYIRNYIVPQSWRKKNVVQASNRMCFHKKTHSMFPSAFSRSHKTFGGCHHTMDHSTSVIPNKKFV
mmetsp:Transcript_19696/g.39181  ORF Transcript_19696/g.39181 Transcript_19696/m.39181 type:complete len:261 (-) Transcript_19696:385-1167(-)